MAEAACRCRGYVVEGDWSVEAAGGYSHAVTATCPPRPFLRPVTPCDAALEAATRWATGPEDCHCWFRRRPGQSMVRPKLTTVAQYPGEMGQRLAEVLLSGSGKTELPRQILNSCRFIERASA